MVDYKLMFEEMEERYRDEHLQANQRERSSPKFEDTEK
jgi:hypothetical protein